MDGHIVVVEASWQTKSPEEDLAELRAVIDTLVLEGEDPSPEPTTPPTSEANDPTPLVNWPQSSLEELQEAQELADAGDPDYAWQLEPDMEWTLNNAAFGEPIDTPELLARFIREELGWEKFALLPGSSSTAESQGLRAVGVRFIRCGPEEANPVWPNNEVAGRCVPTIDDFHYETVEIFVAQPGKRGPEGIWVVSAWSEAEPFKQTRHSPTPRSRRSWSPSFGQGSTARAPSST